jgi:hypothetical protein
MSGRSSVTASALKDIPEQRVSAAQEPAHEPAQEPAQEPGAPSRRGWAARFWRRYVRMSVSADPLLSTVWIHGQCLDVSIYDRDWPESYRY